MLVVLAGSGRLYPLLVFIASSLLSCFLSVCSSFLRCPLFVSVCVSRGFEVLSLSLPPSPINQPAALYAYARVSLSGFIFFQ